MNGKEIIEIANDIKLNLFGIKSFAEERGGCGVVSLALYDFLKHKYPTFALVDGKDAKKKHHVFLYDKLADTVIDPTAGQYGYYGNNGTYIGTLKGSPSVRAISTIKPIKDKLKSEYQITIDTHFKYCFYTRSELREIYHSLGFVQTKEHYAVLRLL